MFLVEYVQTRKNKKFDFCNGYYTKEDALKFALKLNICANIESVTVSYIDVSFADIIFDSGDKNVIKK